MKLYSQLGSTSEYLGLATMMLEHPEEGNVAVVTFNYDTSVEEAISIISTLMAEHWPAGATFLQLWNPTPFQSASPQMF